MRYKRSERIVYMTQYLINNPNKLVPLTYFVTKFEQAKSSISEDVQIIKETLVKEGLGTVETISGASGGVKYRPQMQKDEAQAVIEEVIALLQEKERLLPGGYLFLSDLMGNPRIVKTCGPTHCDDLHARRVGCDCDDCYKRDFIGECSCECAQFTSCCHS